MVTKSSANSPASVAAAGASGSKRKLVAFDFDGTLTYKDSFNAFLLYRFGAYRLALTFGMKPGILANYLATRDRGFLKSHLLYNLLGGISQSEFETDIAAFVARTGMRLFRPDALTTWRDWNRPGIIRVIVTASPELLVGQFGVLIGADRVMGTRLKFAASGAAEARLTPNLDGVNCRGAEKVRRLKEVFGESLDLDAAYGDTDGDREMLAAARQGHYRVFTGKP